MTLALIFQLDVEYGKHDANALTTLGKLNSIRQKVQQDLAVPILITLDAREQAQNILVTQTVDVLLFLFRNVLMQVDLRDLGRLFNCLQAEPLFHTQLAIVRILQIC